jgi:hypothetical protein|tara:strand:- start:153 stop:455 length:303 start_codon:yes stop_codon:yes gene_type:complete
MKDKRTYTKLKEHGEDMTHENESTITNEGRGPLDLAFVIQQHKAEIWKYKQKESEWIKTQNVLDGTKLIVEELSAKIIDLKKEIDRLSEENTNLKIITNK